MQTVHIYPDGMTEGHFAHANKATWKMHVCNFGALTGKSIPIQL